ncbi:MAG: type VI secretion system ATPase TssH [Phycisphaerae bacterium]
MADISRAAFFKKLNSVGYKCFEAATVAAKTAGNPYIEIVHLLNQVFTMSDSDIHQIVNAFGVNPARLASDLQSAMAKLPRGGGSYVDFSTPTINMVLASWKYASLMFSEQKVRTGHWVVALVKEPDLRGYFLAISREFEKIKPEALTDDFAKITARSPEEQLSAREGDMGGGVAPGEASGSVAPAQMGKQEALKKFTVDLTEKARKGEIDPIVGRDDEIRQIVDVLMRRRQNNPILTGEAGVGKTAVVEGFALRIARGDVPPQLKDVTLRSLEMGVLQAGASMKGEFENRLKGIIDEVQSSPKPIILFIDEAHQLMGAGGGAGTGDAAQLLKPALARGTLRTIAATTWDEYKKHIEKDPALVRRFQVIKIDEPDEKKAVLMMRGVSASFEKHHKVQILDEAIEASVKLSARYIPASQLPDKSVKLIDTAAARVAISQHAVPAQVDDSRKRIEALETELAIIEKETAVGIDHKTRAAEVNGVLAKEKERLAGLEKRWNDEKELIAKVIEIRSKLRGAGEPIESAADPKSPKPDAATALKPEEKEKLITELQGLQTKVSELQGENPLIFPCVDAQSVASVVADWTGIPVGRMAKNELEQVLKLADVLEKRVIGQRHALEMISKRVRTSRARLDNPNRPVGVFMLVGPSGTGKTETALTLAETLYGGEQNLIKINMAEFQEAHTVSTLKGSPPGYVGYGEGGVLTEAVRRRPYSVVLLDEVEKAHPDVHEIFFEVFDRGHMEDGEGRDIDFKNTIIILTSNAAQDVIINMCKDPDLMPDAEALEKAMRPHLVKTFPDALLNRLVVVPFYPISKEMLRTIIRLNLNRVEKRVKENHKVPFTFDDAVPNLIADRCTELERGARMVESMITNSMLPEIGQAILSRMVEGKAIAKVHVSVADGNFAYAYD